VSINTTLKALGLPLVDDAAEPRFSPPAVVREAARRGLELRRITGRGGLDREQARRLGVASGIARAEQLAAGEALTLAELKRMKAFFARHDGERERNVRLANERSRASVAWLLWGGDPGREWAQAIVANHGAPGPTGGRRPRPKP
jgi:hypothetical protein